MNKERTITALSEEMEAHLHAIVSLCRVVMQAHESEEEPVAMSIDFATVAEIIEDFALKVLDDETERFVKQRELEKHASLMVGLKDLNTLQAVEG